MYQFEKKVMFQNVSPLNRERSCNVEMKTVLITWNASYRSVVYMHLFFINILGLYGQNKPDQFATHVLMYLKYNSRRQSPVTYV